jgi:hypothetical protein
MAKEGPGSIQDKETVQIIALQFPTNMLLCFSAIFFPMPIKWKLCFSIPNAMIGMITLARIGLIPQQGWCLEQ